MKFVLKLILITICLFSFYSCTINSNRMLRTPRDFEYNKIEAELNNIEYKIDINDQLTFQLYTNNGFQLIDKIDPKVEEPSYKDLYPIGTRL